MCGEPFPAPVPCALPQMEEAEVGGGQQQAGLRSQSQTQPSRQLRANR